VLAEMRTGANFLEANLNMHDGVTCYGEAFNPSFIGHPKAEDLLGIDQANREEDPNYCLKGSRKATLWRAFGSSTIMNHACCKPVWMIRGARKLF
jgi:hypothetical protein